MIRLWAPSSIPFATVSFTLCMILSKFAWAAMTRWNAGLRLKLLGQLRVLRSDLFRGLAPRPQCRFQLRFERLDLVPKLDKLAVLVHGVHCAPEGLVLVGARERVSEVLRLSMILDIILSFDQSSRAPGALRASRCAPDPSGPLSR